MHIRSAARILFSLFLLSGCLRAQLTIGVIDQNQEGTYGAYLKQVLKTSPGPVVEIFDFRRQVNQFVLLEDDTTRVLFETRQSGNGDRFQAVHNNFVLLERKLFGFSVVDQLDIRTGAREELFTGSAGYTFSAGIANAGYAYLDHEKSLWITEGTATGTFNIANNVNDAEGFSFGNLTLITSSEGIHVTDGTPAGTNQIFTSAVSNIQEPFLWNDRFFIPMPNGLIVTDGTATGTRYLIAPAQQIFPQSIAANEDGVFFVARNATTGREAWQTDGTAAGTRIIRELAPGPEDGVLGSFSIGRLDRQLVFRGGTAETSHQVYLARRDSLQVLLELDPATITRANHIPVLMGVTAGGTIFLTTNHLQDRQTLWRVRPGMQPVQLGEFNAFSLRADRAVIVGERLFYQGGADEERLYVAQATGMTTTEVGELGEYNGRWLVNDNYLYYAVRSRAREEFNEQRLYRVGADGIAERYGVNSPAENTVLPIFPYDSGLAAFAIDPFSAEGLFRLDDVANPTLLADLLPYTDNAFPSVLGQAGEMLYVTYQSGIHVIRPGATRAEWVADFLETSTRFTAVGNYLLFNPSRDSIGLLGPEGVTMIGVPPEFQTVRSGYVFYHGAIYFLVNASGVQGTRFHFVRMPLDDPTALTAVYSLESDERLDDSQFAARQTAVVNDKLYFPYPTFEHGWEVGQSDGTPAGTGLYRDLVPGPVGSTPRYIIGGDGRLVVLTRGEVIPGRTLYLEIPEQDQAYWYEMIAFADRPYQVRGTTTHSFIGLRQSTTGDAARVIEDANGEERETPINLNSQFRKTPDGRLTYHVSNNDLRLTRGPVSTDETLTDVEEFSGEKTGILGNYFLHVISDFFTRDVATIDLTTGERTVYTDYGDDLSVDFYVAAGRAYFPGVTDLVGEELFYFEEGGPNRVSGRVYEDLNGNGTEDAGEPPLEGVLVRMAGSYRTQTRSGADGRFSLPLSPEGNFTISIDGDGCYETLSSPAEYTLSAADFPADEPVFGLRRTAETAAIGANVTTAPVRCGFTIPVWLTVRNTGCVRLDASLNLRLPEGVTYVSADQEPSETNGRTLTWRVGDLPSGVDRRIRLLLEMPDESRVGEPVNFRLEANGGYGVDQEVTGEAIYAPFLRCAIDPNDKLVQPARPEPTNSNYTQVDETLTYTIRFQNTGNDTATDVRLEDQLAAELDQATFKPVAASHDYRVELSPTGLLSVFFGNIMLPDSNVNQAASNGFFAFEIDLKPDALEQTVTNTADIFFDFNAPVITNTTANAIVEFLDEDADGFFFWEECDDKNEAINPAAFDVAGNGIDENCDGEDSPVSTAEPLLGELTIFPNPVQDRLTIRYDRADEMLVRVFDGRGRGMQSLLMRGETTLHLGQLAAGVYLISVRETNSGRELTQRVIIW